MLARSEWRKSAETLCSKRYRTAAFFFGGVDVCSTASEMIFSEEADYENGSLMFNKRVWSNIRRRNVLSQRFSCKLCSGSGPLAGLS